MEYTEKDIMTRRESLESLSLHRSLMNSPKNRNGEVRSQFEAPIYEQKISFLELQLQEYKTREENLKKMNENIMEAISESNSKQHLRRTSIDYENANIKNQELVIKINELMVAIQEKDKIINELKFKVENLKSENKNIKKINETETNNLKNEIQNYNEKISQLKNSISKERNKNPIQDVRLGEKTRQDSNLVHYYTNEINQQKENYEKEIFDLKTELNRTKRELSNFDRDAALKRKASKEIEELNTIHKEEVNFYKALNKSFQLKIKNLQGIVKKLNFEIKENEKNIPLNNSNRQNITIKACEYDHDQDFVKEKVGNIENTTIKKLSNKSNVPKLDNKFFSSPKSESNYNKSPQNLFHSPLKIKSKFEKPSNYYYQLSNGGAKKKLDENSASPISLKENIMIQSISPFESNPPTNREENNLTDRLQRSIRENIIKKSLQNQTEFNTSKKRFSVPNIEEKSEKKAIKITFSDEKHQNNNFSSLQDTTDHIDNLSKEKSQIFLRLKELESQLQSSESQNNMLLHEKRDLELQLKGILVDLTRTKEDWMVSDNLKNEHEDILKKEIKTLISKFLKAKSSEKKLSVGAKSSSNLQKSRSFQKGISNSRIGHRNCVVDQEMRSLTFTHSANSLTANSKTLNNFK